MGWLPAEAWQYNSAVTVSRVFVMRGRSIARVFSITGSDTHISGHGRTLGKLLSLIPVANGTGESPTSESSPPTCEDCCPAGEATIGPVTAWVSVTALNQEGREVSARWTVLFV